MMDQSPSGWIRNPKITKYFNFGIYLLKDEFKVVFESEIDTFNRALETQINQTLPEVIDTQQLESIIPIEAHETKITSEINASGI